MNTGLRAVVAVLGAVAFGGVASAATPTFTVRPAVPLGPSLAGFGGQFNQNLYSRIDADVGIDASNVGEIETRVAALAPDFGRVFVDSGAIANARKTPADCDLLDSLVKTIALADESGATLDVTWWKGNGWGTPDASMDDFAALLADLALGTRNADVDIACHEPAIAHPSVRFATIQNEPNGHDTNAIDILGPRPDLYSRVYHRLDADLRALGARDRVRLMGGDLLRPHQQEWFDYMANRMGDVLDAWSIHVYWNYWDEGYGTTRLSEVRAIVNALPAEKRRPLFVTEYGVRGHLSSLADPGPGTWNGTPVERAPRAVLQQAAFAMRATRLGYAGLSKWDLYASLYSEGARAQFFSSVGFPSGGFLEKPSYHLTRLLTHAIPAGMHAVSVNGSASGLVVAAFRNARDTVVVVVNESGSPQAIRLAGLRARTKLYRVVWNASGDGRLSAAPPVLTTATGTLSTTVGGTRVTVFSTRAPGLGL